MQLNPLKQFAIFGLVSALLPLTVFGQSGKAAVSCNSLARLALPSTTINAAEVVAAGAFQLPAQSGSQAAEPGAADAGEQPLRRGTPTGREPIYASKLPAFCRVTASLAPTSDSNIGSRTDHLRLSACFAVQRLRQRG